MVKLKIGLLCQIQRKRLRVFNFLRKNKKQPANLFNPNIHYPPNASIETIKAMNRMSFGANSTGTASMSCSTKSASVDERNMKNNEFQEGDLFLSNFNLHDKELGRELIDENFGSVEKFKEKLVYCYLEKLTVDQAAELFYYFNFLKDEYSTLPVAERIVTDPSKLTVGHLNFLLEAVNMSFVNLLLLAGFSFEKYDNKKFLKHLLNVITNSEEAKKLTIIYGMSDFSKPVLWEFCLTSMIANI